MLFNRYKLLIKIIYMSKIINMCIHILILNIYINDKRDLYCTVPSPNTLAFGDNCTTSP